ncbi:MAG TPA: GNAT family N-acetyltransferase [Ktedonobacteraceae bacterium]
MILQQLAAPALIEAIEKNFTEEMAWFGRALPRAELHKTPELLTFYTGAGGPNGVLYARFASENERYVLNKIYEVMDYFGTHGVSFGWSVGPSTRPSQLAAILESRGFVYSASTMGMAVDLLAMREDVPHNMDLVIIEIQDLEHLRILRDMEMRGFGATEEMAQHYHDVYAGAGFGNGLPWHHFIGWLRGEPVAIASLLYHAGVAGIYGVTTIPEARRQGVGAAMTLHVLRFARSTGYRIAILSPTSMSEAIYRLIGFNDYCKIHHYGSPPRK